MLEDNIPKLDEVYYGEHDCGSCCTVEGCSGHESDIPYGILIDGVWFHVEDFLDGDFPVSKERVDEIKKVVKRLEKFLGKSE